MLALTHMLIDIPKEYKKNYRSLKLDLYGKTTYKYTKDKNLA